MWRLPEGGSWLGCRLGMSVGCSSALGMWLQLHPPGFLGTYPPLETWALNNTVTIACHMNKKHLNKGLFPRQTRMYFLSPFSCEINKLHWQMPWHRRAWQKIILKFTKKCLMKSSPIGVEDVQQRWSNSLNLLRRIAMPHHVFPRFLFFLGGRRGRGE